MKVYVIRHGETVFNRLNKDDYVVMGGQHDSPLTEQGIWDATELSKVAPRVDAVYSSDSPRCIDTASLVYPGIDVCQDARLRERSLGVFEGMNYRDAAADEKYADYFNNGPLSDFRHSFVNKAPDGESYEDVGNRVDDFLSDIKGKGHNTVAIVTHMTPAKMIARHALNLTSVQEVLSLRIPNTTIIEFDMGGKAPIAAEASPTTIEREFVENVTLNELVDSLSAMIDTLSQTSYRRIVVGITGAGTTGKSTIANELGAKHGGMTICTDDWLIPKAKVTPTIPGQKVTACDPVRTDIDALSQAIIDCAETGGLNIPPYDEDYVYSHKNAKRGNTVAEVVLVEGIGAAFVDPALFDISLFVDIDANDELARRERDMIERNVPREKVIADFQPRRDQYEQFVQPMAQHASLSLKTKEDFTYDVIDFKK